MDLPSQMALFAKVVEGGSISAAARATHHTPSAVSKQVTALENRLGVRLLSRSSSGIALTAEGRAVYDRCAEMTASVDAVEALAEEFSGGATGRLRIASTVAFGKTQLIPALGDFMAARPGLRVSLELSDRPVDLATEEVDVVIRFTEQVHDDHVVARRLARNRRIVVGSPDYLARHGWPARPSDLREHNCLQLSTVSGWNEWGMVDEEGAPMTLDGDVEANSADAIYHAALAGLGLARLSTYLVGEDVRVGRLVRVLPDYVQEDSDIVATFLSRRNLPIRTRAFLDWLVDRFGPVPPWERDGAPDPFGSDAAG